MYMLLTEGFLKAHFIPILLNLGDIDTISTTSNL